MKENWDKNISLISRGTRYQVQVATALMGVIPLLVVYFFVLTVSSPHSIYSGIGQLIIVSLTFLLAVSGYALLCKYPTNILKLRQYLRQIAEGELPEKVALDNSADDIRAIEGYLNQVLTALRDKVQRLEQQLQLACEMKSALEVNQRELLAAERHRVMIQSLGAACHHIGQPATVLRTHLHFLRNQTVMPRELDEIAECERAVEAIAAVLEKLRHVSAYRTTPYLAVPAGSTEDVILDIGR
ncbi:MAG: hypothetical protein EPN23_02930 [Verrucomicrobia bacterium]|nr:MAG: hypothetical protein EPN23_02930 [Verrucomicrobiota bacterium]